MTPQTSLSKPQLRYLRGIAQHINPVVTVAGRGLVDTVMTEIERGLSDHELIKIKLRADREQRQQWSDEIVKRTGAARILEIGQVLSIYRANPKNPQIAMPS